MSNEAKVFVFGGALLAGFGFGLYHGVLPHVLMGIGVLYVLQGLVLWGSSGDKK